MNLKRIGLIPNWLGIIIIVAAVVIIVLILLGNKYHQPIAPEGKIQKEQQPEQQAEQQEIFSYIGRITEIKPGKIVFKAEAVKNYLDKDTLITALLTEQTQYFKVGVPKALPEELEGGEGKSLFSREKIKLSDLKLGDEITVISTTNVRGKTEFAAAKIEITVIK